MQALVCTGGLAPSQLPPELIDTPATVICADSGYHSALALGLHPHWLVGDLDSLTISERALAPGCRIERSPRDKDHTDSELALLKAQELGCTPITLIGGGGLRTDHLLALVWLYEGSLFPDLWITDRARIHCLNATRTAPRNWRRSDLVLGEVVSLLPVGKAPWKLRSSGLRWSLNGVRWSRTNSGISNYAVDTNVCIEVQRGRVLIMRHLPPIIDNV